MWGRADKAVKLLGRNIPSILRMTEGVDLKISRRLCIKPQQDLQSKQALWNPKALLRPSSDHPASLTVVFGGVLLGFLGRSASGVPGYKPTLWERRFLLWAGHFKKLEDIPETVSLDTVQAAKTTLRIKFSYVMIALTIVGCITMVIRGKQGMKRHESLTNINLEKKAQWKAEASAKP
ncbi:Protein FAM162A [Lonchura striata]|uniref:Protein FAM162A n=1 Tax=Lonchura striata TaxID=40157 RepID=A0A218VE29_9PASE|nr:Protein FAM162A [Lonchura striata domestica]